jgi:hypothetical protein
LRRVFALASLLIVAACAGNRTGSGTTKSNAARRDETTTEGVASAPEHASQTPNHRAADETDAPWKGGSEIRSNDGAWTVVYKVDDPGIRRGETFDLDAWVFVSGDASKPRADVSLAVDAAMPQHGHGMNRVPKIEKLPDGGFRAEGLLFHMPGKWELYFDVARGPLVERAQVDVEVE